MSDYRHRVHRVLTLAARVTTAAHLHASDLGARVDFDWEGTSFDGRLLGVTTAHMHADAPADAGLPVQLLVDTGVALGPQWFEVESTAAVRVQAGAS